MSTGEVDKVRQRLVQTTLTSAFTSSGLNRTTLTTSPYFTKPSPTSPLSLPASTSASNDPNAHLTPSRRANLKSAPLNTTPATNSVSPPPPPTTKRSALLALTAHETKSLLPPLLARLPSSPPTGHLLTAPTLPPLTPTHCPHLPPTPIRVLNTDTLDAALALALALPPIAGPPILVLNMANAHHGGGGWLRGALAQEESLCYRTSLSFTLKRRFYPLPAQGCVYSPTVVVVRASLAAGHAVLAEVATAPERLPVVSVVSVAAVRGPEVVRGGGGGGGRYVKVADRVAMKGKMRGVLRCAAWRGHRRVVLGALGCGAFGNPRGQVVACWREVFAEAEFGGGWWESVVFAVLEEGGERGGEGNFGVFWRGLDGVLV